MHPVIQNLLNRAGKTVPIKDGRKIALVLFSGLMKGVRGAGAMIALEDLGLTNAFDEIYTFSCGFPNASYLLSKNIHLGSTIWHEEMSGNKFINFLKFWKIADIEKIIKVMQTKKPLNLKNIFQSRTKIYARLSNLTMRIDEYLEIHDAGKKNYFKLMKAAISVPVLHRGSTQISGQIYTDAAKLDNSHISAHFKHVLKSNATDILCIYNDATQVINHSSQQERIYSIFPNPKWKLNLLETGSEKLKNSANQMELLVKEIFSRTKQ